MCQNGAKVVQGAPQSKLSSDVLEDLDFSASRDCCGRYRRSFRDCGSMILNPLFYANCNDLKVLIKKYKCEKGEMKKIVLRRMSEVEKGTPVYKMLYNRMYPSEDLLDTDKSAPSRGLGQSL